MQHPKIRYTKVREVKSPVRGHAADAGFDLFVPTDLLVDSLSFSVNDAHVRRSRRDIVSSIELMPLGRIKIPAGLHFDIPKGWALIACNKSGVSHGRGVVFMANLLDAGYQGEANISIANLSNSSIEISAGEKIIQLVMIPINDEELVEVPSISELYSTETSRGAGGFGSTGSGLNTLPPPSTTKDSQRP